MIHTKCTWNDIFCIHRELLGFLTKEQLMKLERALCSAEGIQSLEDTPSMCSDSGTRPQSIISTSSADSSLTDQSSKFDPEIIVEMNEVGVSTDNNEVCVYMYECVYVYILVLYYNYN